LVREGAPRGWRRASFLGQGAPRGRRRVGPPTSPGPRAPAPPGRRERTALAATARLRAVRRVQELAQLLPEARPDHVVGDGEDLLDGREEIAFTRPVLLREVAVSGVDERMDHIGRDGDVIDVPERS